VFHNQGMLYLEVQTISYWTNTVEIESETFLSYRLVLFLWYLIHLHIMIYYCMKMLKTKQMWLEQTTYFSTNECISLIIKMLVLMHFVWKVCSIMFKINQLMCFIIRECYIWKCRRFHIERILLKLKVKHSWVILSNKI
jgi:hypothetical protein